MLAVVTKPAIDIAQLVGRREQFAYEQHLARSTYAYGVDLRRSAWLDRSTVGDPLMRSVDRRWNDLVTSLTADELLPGSTLPASVMDELLGLVRLLHAPWPSVRVLQPKAAEHWPIVTPLGATKGGSHWLVVDEDRLMSLPDTERLFLLASSVAHLQCDHGPLFAAHLMAHRAGRGEGLVRTLLRPWSRVCVFSADRAGLLAVDELEHARDALRAHADPGIPWLPPTPDVAERLRALEEFSKSRVLTRLRLSGPRDGWTLAPRLEKVRTDEHVSESDDQDDEGPNAGGANPDAKTEVPEAAKSPAAEPAPPPPPVPDDPVAEAEAAGEKLAAEQEAADSARDAQEDELAKAKAREMALAEAWSLARCDQRLTRRLGLL